MNGGLLKDRLKFYDKITSKSSTGSVIETNSMVYECRGFLGKLSGGKNYKDNLISIDYTSTLRIRYTSSVNFNENMVVLINDSVYFKIKTFYVDKIKREIEFNVEKSNNIR